jgi:hypothetical protein
VHAGRERLHPLAGNDEVALAEHGRAPATGTGPDRLELPFRHLHERGAVAERAQEPDVDDAHVVIAGQRQEMPPLLEVHAVRPQAPEPLDVEQARRAQTGAGACRGEAIGW